MIDILLDRYLRGHPMAATAIYLGVVAALLFAAWTASADIYERHAALSAASDLLDQLEGRKQRTALDTAGAAATTPTGSPLLEGSTMTVAGAGLLQRTAGAITTVGGNILSSQVDLQGPLSKDGYISVTVNCELDQPALQKLLYDLESGMPFLFVDQLAVQTLTGPGAEANSRLRVLLAVSGRWQGEK
jgi:general secretion pathway protein M